MPSFKRTGGQGGAGLLLTMVVMLMNVTSRADAAGEFGLVTDTRPGPGTQHALGKLREALEARGLTVTAAQAPGVAGRPWLVAGTTDANGPAARIGREVGIRLDAAESLAVRRLERGGEPGVLVLGRDDRGLMYALLDVAKRVGRAPADADPLGEVVDATEAPAVTERAVSKYTMHRATFEAVFHDEAYWARYFDLLAENRFNAFVLIFGYENGGYFAPPYPYFFDTQGFPDVRVVEWTAEDQRRCQESLTRMIDLAHERGLRVTIGIWDHIYRGGVQGPTEHSRRPTPGLVWGLSAANLAPYTIAAFREFLERVPGLDALQLRMHGESGLTRDEMQVFWPEMFRVIREVRPGLRVELRAKGFPDNLIEKAREAGLDFRIATKYWAEQMGLPFHPTHINRQNQFDRRHGYADLLRYPKQYPVHWRLWNGGTTRVLLWGDPDYVRRFAASTHLYDGDGFEVNEMVATKMQDHPHDEPPFELLAPERRYYDWEFERYWHFYQVFGRVGYNPDAPAAVWEREFTDRFGPEAGPRVMKALHRASGILPRITAAVFPYGSFPTTRGWAEKQRRGDLPDYARADVSDTEQFLTMDEAARLIVEGGTSPRRWPGETARWFAQAAEDVLALAAEAERAGGARAEREFEVTLVDLRILAHLARFHAARMPAGVAWRLFERTRDVHALDEAIEGERRAVAAWQDLVAAAGDVYAGDLKFGRASAGLSGHWRDELALLERGLAALERLRGKFHPDRRFALRIAHVPVRGARPGEPLRLRATVWGKEPIEAVRVRFGAGEGGEPAVVTMQPTGPFTFEATVPGADVREGLAYRIEAVNRSGRTAVHPPAEEPAIGVRVTDDREPPTVEHRPIAMASPGRPLKVAARVLDPSGVASVRLRYRPVNQQRDYASLEMAPGRVPDVFEAEVPGEDIDPAWDFMYFIEALDRFGNGCIWPDLEREAPYVVVPLDRQ